MRWLLWERITLTLALFEGEGKRCHAFEMTGMKSDKFGGRGWVAVLAMMLAAALLVGMACFQDTSRSLVLTTTTSTYDSGLLDYIIPPFEEEYNVHPSNVTG